MNNRYICKGKTTYDKWVDGDLITFGGRCYIHPQNSDFEVKSGLARIVRVYKVIPETVGQCTGLKDKNGKLIFEGDICKHRSNCSDKFVISVVTYTDGHFLALVNEHSGFELSEKLEIIGNIHDNPELVEVKR